MDQELFNPQSSSVSSSRIIYTPSTFARTSLLHLQEVGSLQAVHPHISQREDLVSFLCFIVLSGEGELSYEEQTYQLSERDCVFIDCRKAYSHSTSDNLWSLQWCHFYAPSLPAVYEKYKERGGRPVFHPGDLTPFTSLLTDLYNLASSSDYICEHYSIPVADTIAAFNNSGKAYDDLTGDGVHPNEAGQEIYFETVKAVIDDNVTASTGKMTDTDVINADVHKFDNFVWYDASSDFERVDDTTFTISVSATGVLGIDYTYESGDNKADIYVDGELFESPTVTFDYDFSQRHILVVSDDCTVNDEIKVVFTSKEQADGFQGMCFSWK